MDRLISENLYSNDAKTNDIVFISSQSNEISSGLLHPLIGKYLHIYSYKLRLHLTAGISTPINRTDELTVMSSITLYLSQYTTFIVFICSYIIYGCS